METPVSETSHFPVRLMSFLHSTLKTKCKYLVITVIATKMWRPDATRHAKRPTQEVNFARLRSRMPAATFLPKTMIKARVRGPSLFDVYGQTMQALFYRNLHSPCTHRHHHSSDDASIILPQLALAVHTLASSLVRRCKHYSTATCTRRAHIGIITRQQIQQALSVYGHISPSHWRYKWSYLFNGWRSKKAVWPAIAIYDTSFTRGESNKPNAGLVGLIKHVYTGS